MGRSKRITATALSAVMTVTALSAAPMTANAAILESYDSGVFQGHTYA